LLWVRLQFLKKEKKKKKKNSVVVHASNASTWESEVEGSYI
jgi:hypothetical protein